MKVLQDRIRAIRERTGKSMTKIAFEANVSRQNIYKWAKGITPTARDEFERLREYLDQFERNGNTTASPSQSLFFRELEKVAHVQADFIIEMSDESMEPTFKNNCRLLLSELTSPQILIWGRYHAIKTKNEEFIVRRIYEGNQEWQIQTVPDNPDLVKFPPFQIDLTTVEKIYRVTCCLFKV